MSDQKEIDELINRWVHPTDEQQRKHIDIYTDKAEKYFVDLMKLSISLSTGMIAFWGVVNTIKIITVDSKFLLLLFIGYFVSIFFACCAILSLDLHYKQYADFFINEHRRLLKHFKEANWGALKKWREKGLSEYLDGKGRGWQRVTVSLGVAALIIFLISLALTCWPLVEAATH